MGERRWTLEAARALVGDLRTRTERAFQEIQGLLAERALHPPGSAGLRALDARVAAVMERWTREMEALGVEVKGPWLVDFDTGSGYYCWKWPEQSVDFFHGYEEGFAGRTRIQ
jgi:hypothetical protein